MKYFSSFIVGIMLAFCLFFQSCSVNRFINRTNDFSAIEINRLGIEEIECNCILDDCLCNVYINNKFPNYNRSITESYIETKLNARCNFYYEGENK